jgi:hypothetical protein
VVNDAYPEDDVREPANVPDKDRWLYERRRWSFDHDEWTVPEGLRRIGTVWELFEDVEGELSESAVAAAWDSITAVYPEMQDWVARRGHGGAALWSPAASPDRIRELRPDVDCLIVQLHSGFQFQPTPSGYVRSAAQAAIDAGADLVVAHHPHVLQGVEWYRDKLIVYSLGNFVFDQDFFATFPTAFVRTVWEGSELLEARLVPMEIAGYRPRGVTGRAARRVLRDVLERSLLGAESRSTDRGLKPVQVDLGSATQMPRFVLEGNTARIERAGESDEPWTADVPAGSATPLPDAALFAPVQSGGAAGIDLGRDLYGWGHFEHLTADREPELAVHWNLDSQHERVVAGDAFEGERFLRMYRAVRHRSPLLSRPLARIPIPRHRVYGSTEAPLDPTPSYTVRLAARRTGKGEPRTFVRLDFYAFDDSDPTRDPESVLTTQVELDFEVPADGRFHEVEVVVPPAVLQNEPAPNMVLPYVAMEPPATWDSMLDIDVFALVEWRALSGLSPAPGAYEWVRNRSEASKNVELGRFSLE